MHLKPYPKLVKSELRLEPGGIQGGTQRGSLHVGQQGALLRAEWGVRQACITRAVSAVPSNNNHGHVVGSGGRFPLSVISTNTLRRSNSINNGNVNNANGVVSHRQSFQGEFFTTWARKARISSSPTTPSAPPTTFTSSLLLLSSSTSTGCENEGSLGLYQAGAEDGDGPLDIWAVIKPGNTKEKIAIFASGSGRTSSSAASDHSAGSLSGNPNSCGGSGGGDSVPDTAGSSPPAAMATQPRTVSMKAKGCWEGECSVAKRRRRSGSSHHHHQHPPPPLLDQRPKELQQDSHKAAETAPAPVALSQPPRVPEGGDPGGESPQEGEEGEDGGKTLSVVEMVAFLELRASEQQQLDSKPVVSLQRSSTSITLSKAPVGAVLLGPLPSDPREAGGEEEEEEGETVRVSDMVAKLESECLKRRGVGGDLSRNNSLRRAVGRVLLAGADACSVAAQPSSPPPLSSSLPSSLPDIQSQGRLETAPCAGSAGDCLDDSRNGHSSSASPPPPCLASPSDSPASGVSPVRPGEASERRVEGQMESVATAEPRPELTSAELPHPRAQYQAQSHVVLKLQSPSEARAQPQQPGLDSPSQPDEEEPLPGMLFFSHQPSMNSVAKSHTLPRTRTAQPFCLTPTFKTPESRHSKPAADPQCCVTFNPEVVDSPCLLPPPALHTEPSDQRTGNTRTEDNRERREEDDEEDEGEGGAAQDSSAVPFPLRRMVSHEFLEMRFKIQLLLEPQQYLAFLPHHIIVKIFSLLPTQSLAALKCTCHYFKFIIETYGVRPADSRWVCDARYKDDPCKQCKRRYGRGDVSLCRWHHKPYCQAMPYGPGYWMCCHGSHRDAPGCNVGLHDNRWVPAFHSINMPIYKRNRDLEDDPPEPH